MEREKNETYEDYKVRRRLINKALKQRLVGRPVHGFRTFKIDKDDSWNETVSNVVESEYINGERFKVNSTVNYSLTLGKGNK